MNGYVTAFIVIDLFLSAATGLANYGFTSDAKEAWAVFGVLVWVNIAPSIYFLSELAKRVDSDVILALNVRNVAEAEPEPERADIPVIVNLGGGEYQRLAGRPITDWIRVARVLDANSYRLRARVLADDYDWFRSQMESNTVMAVKKGNVVDLTDKGKQTMRMLSHYPTGAKTLPRLVSQRLTHTEHTEEIGWRGGS